MKISLIAAIGRNRELGKDNKLLWNIPEDLRRFKDITNGHPIIMGRKTFDSIGRVLPNRLNIVITRDRTEFLRRVSSAERSEELIVVSSLEEGIRLAEKWLNTEYKIPNTNEKEMFIIGGGQIFSQSMDIADKIYLTVVDKDYPDADAYFPEYGKFSVVESEKNSSYDGLSFTFLDLKKPL